MAICIGTAQWPRTRLIVKTILDCIRTRTKISVRKKLTRDGGTTKNLKFTISTVNRFNKMRILLLL
jgi:hypothetical protein